MKMHWGTGLIGVFGLFVVAVLAVVAFAMTRRVDLVSDGYYERGLAYQQQIDRIDRSRSAEAAVETEVLPQGVMLRFPATSGGVTGEVLAYRPDNRDRDFVLPLGLDASGMMLIPRARLGEGLWRLRITWARGGREFFHEAKVDLR